MSSFLPFAAIGACDGCTLGAMLVDQLVSCVVVVRWVVLGESLLDLTMLNAHGVLLLPCKCH
jgi:hypothetical protein